MPLFKSTMAEISGHRQLSKIYTTGIILFFAALTFAAFNTSLPQEKKKQPGETKKIELLYCDVLIIDKQVSNDLNRLIGNVALKHKDIIMTCDSAHLYREINQVKAYGHVKINQADTLTLAGDYLFYDGNEEKAFVQGNVELKDNESKLYTQVVNYDAKTKIADYPFHGKIINGDNVLTSRMGFYYTSEKKFYFKDSVKIVNPNYTVIADTMVYNTSTETAYFTGPTTLEGDSIYMYCEKGWYDTKNDLSTLWNSPVINNRQHIITGDSLFYDRRTGYGEAFRKISITDTSSNIIVAGNYAWYFREPEKFMVTDSALFIQVSEEDSLFLHSDTISAVTLKKFPSDTSSFRLIRAYYRCKVFSKDFQAKCDSLTYSFQDSVIRLYRDPILWSEENQMVADSMAIFTRNRKTDRMELYNSVFVASQVDSLRFNQMKGRKLTGYFMNNKLYRILIEGNGETVYYLVDNNELIGINHARSASIEILIDDGKVKEINELQNPEGTLDPPDTDSPGSLRLKGFVWYDYLRPKKKTDIFIK
ncbi:MAG: OstA-like protein [Bacteroidales bacterium]